MTPEKIDRYVENRLKYVGRFALQAEAGLTPAALRKPHSKKAWTALPDAERLAHLRAKLIEEASHPAAPTAPTPAPAPAQPDAPVELRRPRPASAAVVQCAGGCGRSLPAPSREKPVLRYCGAALEHSPSKAEALAPAREESVGSAIRRYLHGGSASGGATATAKHGHKTKRAKATRPKCLGA